MSTVLPKAYYDRGLVFREDFNSRSGFKGRGGALYGDPKVRFGLYGDDSGNKYGVQNVGVSVLKGDGVTLSLIFSPNAEPQVGSGIYLLDTQPSRLYVLMDSSRFLLVGVPGVSLFSVTPNVYIPYWRNGAENRMDIVFLSGTSVLYFNGQTIATSATSFSELDGITKYFYLSRYTAADIMDATLLGIEVYHGVLGPQEHIDLFENKTFNLRDETSLQLPCDNLRYDPDNSRTLDISGDANHFVMSGVAQLARGGIENTGTDKMSLANASGVLPNGDIGDFSLFVCYTKSADNVSFDYFVQRGVYSSGNKAMVAITFPSDSKIGFSTGVAASDIEADISSNKGTHTIVYSHESGVQCLYFDGVLVASGTSTTAFNITDSSMTIFQSSTGSNTTLVILNDLNVVRRVATTIQALNYHNEMMERHNG